ncbi:class I SAM-dependent methyltransferase [Candidatus Pacearchaeota archaeon]|nr:class I SAM-dependent methyltransferase [Candidatus Pacearchaeota archaeon]
MRTKEEKEARSIYKDIAEYYHNYRTKIHPKGWFFNEMLEMPATLELLGNVKGKKVLDWGCGSGIYAKLLTKKGAKVKGFDISEEMIKIAKEENPQLDLRVGSGLNIPFKEKFDIVLASLAVHYVKNQDEVLREVSKVLKKGSFFVFSIVNPVAESHRKIKWGKRKISVLDNYFKEGKIYNTWKLSEKKIKVYSYHKTYESIIKTILKNGFEIVGYKDAYPIKKSKRLFPEFYYEYTRIPFFCVWKVRKK